MEVVRERVLPARRAGLIRRESTPRFCKSDQFGDKGKEIEAKKRHQRADNQAQLVTAIMEAESRLHLFYEGEELEKCSKAYIKIAQEVMECSNVKLPCVQNVGVKGGEHNARHLTGLKHCGKPICPNCLPYHDAKRRERLEGVALGLAGLPLKHYMMTITLRHHYSRKGNWKVLVKAIKKTWRSMGKEYFFTQATKDELVKGGYFWKMETTFSYEWGHHPHLHVLISLPSSVDGAEFSQKVKAYWEEELRKEGRSCDWQPGWFQALRSSGEVAKMVKYLTSGITEVTGTATKKMAPWKLPAEAFVEVYEGMRNEKWFGSGGCWRKGVVVEAESEAKLEQERGSDDPFIYVIPGQLWNGLNFHQRFDVRRIIGDKSLTHADCVANLEEFFVQIVE